ncbi:MAG: hypothetical protein WBB85_03500 [Albidovulum sp.]
MPYRLIALLALVGLTACQGRMAEPVMEPTPMVEELVVEEPVMVMPAPTDCTPGEGDGIGGTGCQID